MYVHLRIPPYDRSMQHEKKKNKKTNKKEKERVVYALDGLLHAFVSDVVCVVR